MLRCAQHDKIAGRRKMTARTRKLRVVKNDGTREEYIHTKVIGTIANALSAAGQSDIKAAEELAEAVTFFLYKAGAYRDIITSEILSIIKTVLACTGYELAAVALSEHHIERRLRRSRIEVVDNQKAESIHNSYDIALSKKRWDKSRIVEDLIAKHNLPRPVARTIASMVEEKVFNMGLSLVPHGLIQQLVLNDASAVIQAQQQLQLV
jgi:hypothetical protein